MLNPSDTELSVLNLSDTEPVGYRTYQTPNKSDTDLIFWRFWTSKILSDAKSIRYWTYETSNLSDIKPFRYQTYLINLSNTKPIWYRTLLIANLSDTAQCLPPLQILRWLPTPPRALCCKIGDKIGPPSPPPPLPPLSAHDDCKFLPSALFTSPFNNFPINRVSVWFCPTTWAVSVSHSVCPLHIRGDIKIKL